MEPLMPSGCPEATCPQVWARADVPRRANDSLPMLSCTIRWPAIAERLVQILSPRLLARGDVPVAVNQVISRHHSLISFLLGLSTSTEYRHGSASLAIVSNEI